MGSGAMLAMIQELAPAFSSTGSIALSDDEGIDVPVPDYFGNPLPPYLTLKDYRWDGGTSGTVCMQFNGRSNYQIKNPPAADQWRMHERWQPTVHIGLPMSWQESARHLASCRFFVGCCSGMSHIAHSVGCPTIVIKYGQPDIICWHPKDGWTLAHGTDEAIRHGDRIASLALETDG